MTAATRRLTPRPSGVCDEAAVLDALGSGVVSIRDDGVIVRANAGATRILRRPLADLLGRDIGDVLASLGSLRAATEEAKQARAELLVELEGGVRSAIGFALSSFTGADGRTRFVLQFQDITPLHELRKQRDRLLAMAALGDALPSVLHELRNPLAAVTARLELMVEETEGTLQLDLHAVLSEVRRMSLGLDGVGGFVRSAHTGGHAALDLAVVDACRVLEPVAERAGVALEAREHALPLLPLDRGVVGGVVFNLVKNAIDATPRGGHVVVAAELEDRGATFALRVSDDGTGMTDEVRERCTELFFTRKDKGSGIGLALCKRVAESSGGELDIRSAAGHGTTVTLRLPLAHPTTFREPIDRGIP